MGGSGWFGCLCVWYGLTWVVLEMGCEMIILFIVVVAVVAVYLVQYLILIAGKV